MGDAGGLGQTIEQIKNILDEQRQISQKSNDVGMHNLGKRPIKWKMPTARPSRKTPMSRMPSPRRHPRPWIK